MSTTPDRAAAQLRALADALDHADTMQITGYVSFSPTFTLDQNARVATVDILAARFGLTAEPTKTGSTWYHAAEVDRDGVNLRIDTHINAPAQRCACGAVCTHTD